MSNEKTTDWGLKNERAIAARPGMEDTIFPIPIREGVTVRVQGLPFDLSRAEAEKIAAVILAYAGLRQE